jgi:type IV pilus assembly protein PilW
MSGFSLVELMIAMTLGLASVAAVGWVYLGTMQTYRTHDALSRLQEGARHSFELIAKDLRMAGVTGCSYSSTMNALSAPTNIHRNLFEQPLISSPQNGGAGTTTEFSDALTVLRADVTREYIVQAHNSGASTFTLTAVPDFSPGQLLVATNCSHASVFQASAIVGSTVTHLAGGGGINSTPNLGAPLGAVYTYGANSRLYRMSSVTYYVDQNAAGVPALFRQVPVGTAATLTPEELVEGVEDLRITYAVDTTPTPDGQSDLVGGVPYLTATEVTNSVAFGASAADRWSRVVSIRISMLLRTVEDRVVREPQNYAYNGDDDIDAPDLRLRKVFTHVIKLRNR